MKRESFWDFISNNRHELLPDKLSSMVHVEHSVLSFLNSKKTKYQHESNTVFCDLIDLLESIKENLEVDNEDYLDNSEINFDKGSISPESASELKKKTEIKYTQLVSTVSDNKMLASFYSQSLGKHAVILYLSGIKSTRSSDVRAKVLSLGKNAAKLLTSNKESKALVRPLIKAISIAQRQDELLKDFDSKIYTINEQDVYVTTVYCLYELYLKIGSA